MVYFQFGLSVLDMMFLNLYSDVVEMEIHTLVYFFSRTIDAVNS